MNMKIVDDKGLRAVFAELDRRAANGLKPWSKSDLAAEIGIQKQAINNWQRIPAERVPAVAKILGLKKSTLRPDLYEPVDDGAPLVAVPRSKHGKLILKAKGGAAHGRRR